MIETVGDVIGVFLVEGLCSVRKRPLNDIDDRGIILGRVFVLIVAEIQHTIEGYPCADKTWQDYKENTKGFNSDSALWPSIRRHGETIFKSQKKIWHCPRLRCHESPGSPGSQRKMRKGLRTQRFQKKNNGASQDAIQRGIAFDPP